MNKHIDNCNKEGEVSVRYVREREKRKKANKSSEKYKGITMWAW